MNESEPMRPDEASSLDSAEVTAWLRRHAQRHGVVLDAAQERALPQFERLYEDLLGLDRMDSWLVRLLATPDYYQGGRVVALLTAFPPLRTLDFEPASR